MVGRSRLFSFLWLSIGRAISVIVVLGFIVYGNVFFNGFVWDDYAFIIANPDLHTINIVTAFLVNTFNGEGYYRAISALYFALLHGLFGSQAFFYHFFQVSLHIFNSILVYIFFRIFFSICTITNLHQKGKPLRIVKMSNSVSKMAISPDSAANIVSFFLSLLFLVHPINVESVAYIAASQSELFFLFGILGLLISMRKEISALQVVLVSFLSLFSLLTKETGILFLFMIVCFQLFFNRKRLLPFFIAEFVTFVGYCFIRFVIAGVFLVKLSNVPIAKLSFWERVVNVPAVFYYYVTITLFPLRLAVWQKWIITKITVQSFYFPLLIDVIFFIMIFFVSVSLYCHKRAYFAVYLFFTLWFVLGIGMLLQFFPLDMTVADRWFYFPFIGLLGMLGVVIDAYLFSAGRYEKVKVTLVLLGSVVVILLSLRTMIRNADFHDEIRLYAHDIKIQDSSELETYLGIDLAKAGDMQAALPHLKKATEDSTLAPQDFYNIGRLYETQGNLQKAREYYSQAVTRADSYYSGDEIRHPLDEKIYVRLANILLILDDFEVAEKVSTKGLQYFPTSSVLWLELAVSENRLHHQPEAIEAIQKAKGLHPRLPGDFIELLSTMTMIKLEIPSSNMLQITSYISSLISN